MATKRVFKEGNITMNGNVINVGNIEEVEQFAKECRDIPDSLDVARVDFEAYTNQLSESWRDSKFMEVVELAQEILVTTQEALLVASEDLLPFVERKLEVLKSRP